MALEVDRGALLLDAMPGPPSTSFVARRKGARKGPNGSRVFSLRYAPRAPGYEAHLHHQARKMRDILRRPVHVVDYKGKKYLTTEPPSGSKILHVAENAATLAGGPAPSGAT